MSDDTPDQAPLAGSPLAALRERRESLRRDRHLDLEVPGWDGLLVARYGPPEPGAMTRYAEQATILARENRDDAALVASTDILVGLCREILTRGDDGDLVSLAELAGESDAIRYDERLAEHLGYEATSAREVVWGVFPQHPDGRALDYVVQAHANEVVSWLSRVDEEADDVLAGEA